MPHTGYLQFMKTKNVTPIEGRYSLALDLPTNKILNQLRERDGLGITDTIRRALKFLVYIYDRHDAGDQLWVHPADGSAPYRMEIVIL